MGGGCLGSLNRFYVIRTLALCSPVVHTTTLHLTSKTHGRCGEWPHKTAAINVKQYHSVICWRIKHDYVSLAITAHFIVKTADWTKTSKKNNKMSLSMTIATQLPLCSAKSQFSLCIQTVWSESALSAWRRIGSLAALKAQRQRRLWADSLLGAHVILLVLSCLLSNVMARAL